MEQNGDSVQHQEGTPWFLQESQLVTTSVSRAYLPSLKLGNAAQRTREAALRAELDAVLAEQHALDLQLAAAKKKAENEAIKRCIKLFQRIAQSCERCHFPFNVLQEDGTLKVRARDDKQVCDAKLGDPECVKDQQQERDKKRRAEKKAAEHPAQQPRKKTSRAKHPGSRQPVSTNGHHHALASTDQETL